MILTGLTPIVISPNNSVQNYSNTQVVQEPPSVNSYKNEDILIVPKNYPQVQSYVPRSIFETPSSYSTTVSSGYAGNVSYDLTPRYQISPQTPPPTKAEIKWAIELETKVQKEGYQPTSEELVRYQEVVIKLKSNDTKKGGPLLSEIINVVSAQAPALGASVGAQRVINNISTSFTQTVGAIKNGGGIKALVDGGKAIGGGVLKGAGISALVSGVFSGVSNGIGVLTGRVTKADAAGSVAADIAAGAVSGAGGALLGGAAMAGLGAMGVTGLPLTLLAGGATILGAYLGEKYFRKSGAYDAIFNKVSSLVGNK